MPDASWPPGLPQYPLQKNIKGGPEDATIRSKTDYGADRVRQRYSGAVKYFPNITYYFTAAEFAIFETFYETTLKNGSQRYIHLHPINRTAATLRMRGPYIAVPLSFDCISVSFNVEVLP